MAADTKKDVVSAVTLETSWPAMRDAPAENGETKGMNASQVFSIPVGDGISTYVDCSRPSHQDPGIKESASKALRTVFGFHITLQ